MAEVLEKKKSDKKLASQNYDKATYLKWLETMYRIRRFEEKGLFAYSQQKIRGFFHVYIGQEAIAGGLVSALRKEDKIVTAYRQHGIALSRGLSPASCMAELYGKATGCVKGKGGSMHFFSAEHNYFGGNGIVGAQIPIGTGIAFAEKYKGTDNLCVTMFGDGAARQGALYESFNMAMTWKLPVLYICENNMYAMGTSVTRTSNVHDLAKIGLSFDIPSESVDGMNPESVHEALTRAAAHIRAGKGPYYLEIETYRYRGHSVSDPAKYRTKEELEAYKEKDPLVVIQDRIIKQKIASQKEVDDIIEAINKEIDDAMEFAENSPYPLPSELYEDNYTQKDYPYITD
ncbi:MAG: pyruvate dehydrogenase (acetyl-transferring) E1 component subunit alpha [Saprospiraceae bacterium]|jgi:pyruvate dehydrogenase E1 component alpha subunit|nr:pyruvate dehydrogenase (acetyl-transferring) E1 component subunit alpha [Saprospiraceae bacterium]